MHMALWVQPKDVLVESLPARENGQRTDTVSLLREKETDDRNTDTNRPHSIGGINIGLIGTLLI